MKEILNFLSELKQNNNRDWFQQNKEWYLKIKSDHEKLVSEIITGLSVIDSQLQLLKPAECVFRIYRDVRFSKNKDPYKTALGAVFSKGGRKGKYAGYYLHIEPGNSFAGGGIWRPDSDVLKSIRYEIYNSPEELIDITGQEDFKRRFGEISGEKLKNPPKDFPPDFRHIELLKYKSFTVGQPFSDAMIVKDGFYEELMKTFHTMTPFIRYFNLAINEA